MLYVVVTSYRISPEMNAAVYGRLFDEALRTGLRCCVVACITDLADAEVLHRAFERRRAHLAEGSALHLLFGSAASPEPGRGVQPLADTERRGHRVFTGEAGHISW